MRLTGQPKISEPAALALAALAAYWPVWRWYGAEMVDRPQDPWGLLALVLAAVYYLPQRRGGAAAEPAGRRRLIGAAGLTLIYLYTCPWMPHAIQWLLALATLGCLMARRTPGRRLPNLGALGLLVMSLPLLPTLRFFGSYPLRLLCARIAVRMLAATGYEVTLDGVDLMWEGLRVSVDAPCSGVQMLWTGMLLAGALGAFLELPAQRTAGLYFFALAAVIAGNVVRMTALFYGEAAQLKLGDPMHAGVGVAAFAMCCGGIVAMGLMARKGVANEPCAT